MRIIIILKPFRPPLSSHRRRVIDPRWRTRPTMTVEIIAIVLFNVNFGTFCQCVNGVVCVAFDVRINDGHLVISKSVFLWLLKKILLKNGSVYHTTTCFGNFFQHCRWIRKMIFIPSEITLNKKQKLMKTKKKKKKLLFHQCVQCPTKSRPLALMPHRNLHWLLSLLLEFYNSICTVEKWNLN